MKRHKLKCWPEYFEQVRLGHKTFEIRKDDRDFQVGDYVDLQEFVPPHTVSVRERAGEARELVTNDGGYTGRQLELLITYVLKGKDVDGFGMGFGVRLDGLCVFSFRILPEVEGVPV